MGPILGRNDDELYLRAVDLVITGQRASISLLQRSLQIGFSQAAGYMDEMQAVGIVSAHGPKGRVVLVKDNLKVDV